MCTGNCKCKNGGCGSTSQVQTSEFSGMTAGVLGVVAAKMPRNMTHAGMQRVIDHPEISESILAAFANLQPFEVAGCVEITPEEWASKDQDVLHNPILSTSAAEVIRETKDTPPIGKMAVVFVNIGQAGFVTPTLTRDFYKRANKLGLVRCHPMAALKMINRLKIHDGKDVHLGMQAVMCNSDGNARMLVIEKNGNAFMIKAVPGIDAEFEPEDVIAMVASKKLLEELRRELASAVAGVEIQLQQFEREGENADKEKRAKAEELYGKLQAELVRISDAIPTAPDSDAE